MAFYPKSAHSEWLHVMEFCGYVIFFVAIFFVVHALYIIGLSLFSAKQYDMYHSTPVSEILQNIAKSHSTWQGLFFEMRYLPFSSLRSVAEFKIIYALFRDTYWLPSNFDYGSYLAGCFERYSLRIVKIGHFSWFLMFILGVLNYIRVKFMGPDAFNCKGHKTASDISHHGGGHGGGGGGGGESHALDFNLFGEDSETYPPDDIHEEHLQLGGRYGITHSCSQSHLNFYLFCAVLVSLYVIAVYLFGRLYVARYVSVHLSRDDGDDYRLICHAGVTEIKDYGEFLTLEESASLKVFSFLILPHPFQCEETSIRTFEINVEEGGAPNTSRRASSSRRMSINTLRTNIGSILLLLIISLSSRSGCEQE